MAGMLRHLTKDAPMRVPRWLLATMLCVSVLVTLGLGGWWWVVWPERTASEFFDCVERGHTDEATGMLAIHRCHSDHLACQLCADTHDDTGSWLREEWRRRSFEPDLIE